MQSCAGTQEERHSLDIPAQFDRSSRSVDISRSPQARMRPQHHPNSSAQLHLQYTITLESLTRAAE